MGQVQHSLSISHRRVSSSLGISQVKSKLETVISHRQNAPAAKDADEIRPQQQEAPNTVVAREEQRAEQWTAVPEDAVLPSSALPPPPDPDDGSGVIVTEAQVDPAAVIKAIEEAFPSASRVGPDDFEPLKVLGDGCFGKVMLVRRKGTNDVFAMKSIHKDHVIKNKKVRHTKTERNVMTQLRHPFIMQLHFAFQSGGKLYLVMDYFSGGDMFFHLSRERRFAVSVPDPHRSRHLFAFAYLLAACPLLRRRNCIGHRSAACRGVYLQVCNYLTSLFWFCITEVILRDLKPENVLLGSDGNLCLTDFGLSKESVQDNELVHTFVGTTEYLAPEILRQRGYTKAVDWWSLGVLLCVMCLKC